MREMLTLCNTSPLLYLHLVNALDLLPAMYGQIVVPPAVEQELAAGGRQGVNVPHLQMLPWIEIKPVAAYSLIPLVTDLGRGEAELIGLGLEHPDSRLILDDTLGRRIAKLHGLSVTGTAGVVVKAKQSGLITAVKPVIDALRQAGLWLSEAVVQDILREANEG